MLLRRKGPLARAALWLTIVVLSGLGLRNFALLAQDMTTGSGAAAHLLPSPVYRLARLPSSRQTLARDAQHRLGSDFAQVYFPAQDVFRLARAFSSGTTSDPWHRPSRYPPLVILACAATVCRLPFGWASLAHILVQLLVFVAVLYITSGTWRLRRFFLAALLFSGACLFLTPVGLSWFERGQFSLYIAASHMLLLFGLIEKKWAPIALAAMLAFIKWTSFPASAVILAIYLISWRNSGSPRQRLILASVFAVVIGLLLVVPVLFVRGTDLFLAGLFEQELRGDPGGLSLMTVLPPLAVKLLPLLLLLAGVVNLRLNRGDLVSMIPYFIGAAAALLIYPTRAYDYSLFTLAGFIPAALLWAQQSHLRPPSGALVLAAFAAFLAVGSYSTHVLGSTTSTVGIYVVFSIIFVALPSLLAPFNKNAPPPITPA